MQIADRRGSTQSVGLLTPATSTAASTTTTPAATSTCAVAATSISTTIRVTALDPHRFEPGEQRLRLVS